MSEDVFTQIADTLADDLAARETIVADVDTDIVAAIRGAVALRSVVDDALARLTAQAERVGTATRSGMSLRELLCRNGLAPTVASRLIRLGRAIAVLPALARHSRDGTISAEHLDAIARGLEHLARRTGHGVDSPALAAVEPALIGRAIAGNTPAEIVEHARAIAIEMTADSPVDDDPDTADRVPVAENAQLNELDWHTTDDGRLRGQFDLDALTGERLITALDTASRPRPEPDGTPDPRPATRRSADAFTQLLECGTRGLSPHATTSPPRTEILLTIPITTTTTDTNTGTDTPDTPDTRPATPWLRWMGPITDLSAQLLSCDARLAGVGIDHHNTPVSMTNHQRLFTGTTRTAILLRDRCCIKCGAPASWTDVHHITHHSHGGPTTIDNGALLCRRCHTAVHHHGWDITIGTDRHPHLIPPTTIDPHRRPQPSYHRRTMRLDNQPTAA